MGAEQVGRHVTTGVSFFRDCPSVSHDGIFMIGGTRSIIQPLRCMLLQGLHLIPASDLYPTLDPHNMKDDPPTERLACAAVHRVELGRAGGPPECADPSILSIVDPALLPQSNDPTGKHFGQQAVLIAECMCSAEGATGPVHT